MSRAWKIDVGYQETKVPPVPPSPALQAGPIFGRLIFQSQQYWFIFCSRFAYCILFIANETTKQRVSLKIISTDLQMVQLRVTLTQAIPSTFISKNYHLYIPATHVVVMLTYQLVTV